MRNEGRNGFLLPSFEEIQPTWCRSNANVRIFIAQFASAVLLWDLSTPESLPCSLCEAMTHSSKFLRSPNRTNPEITDSFCTDCQTFVGASPRPALLRLMEEAHDCPEDQPKSRAGNRSASRVRKHER